MSVSLQVIYPIGTETHFDFDYYVGTHLPLVGEHMGSHIERTVVTIGIAGGPDERRRVTTRSQRSYLKIRKR